jgi:hypothetical protein
MKLILFNNRVHKLNNLKLDNIMQYYFHIHCFSNIYLKDETIIIKTNEIFTYNRY